MKKSLLAVVLATSSFVASAEVTLYGRIAIGVENDQFQNNMTPGAGSVQSYGTYFGIKGTDPVYGQTSVIWQIEQYIDPTTGQAYTNTSGGGLVVPQGSNGVVTGGSQSGRPTSSINTLASSETYMGLQGAWGKFTMGNLSNYVRSNQGSVDTFNSGNGANGLVYSRAAGLLPYSVRYDSPTWNGFSFAGLYSFNNGGAVDINAISTSKALNNNLNGYYSGGIYNAGLSWQGDRFSATLSTQIWQDVGTYATGASGMSSPVNAQYPNSAYNYAYMNRLELAYEDPEGLLVGVGFQTGSGYGWNSVANSGGSWGNVGWTGTTPNGLTTNQYQTQEAVVSLGYHMGVWMPKIGYAYGNNLMSNGNVLQVAGGTANQIPDSGYQQVVAELDWNITPRTIMFVNYGQTMWGSSAQSMQFGAGLSPTTGGAVGGTGYQQSQSTAAIGMSHTF